MQLEQVFPTRIIRAFYCALIAIAVLLPSISFAKPYVVGKLHGQFGNQLFGIAAATSLALDNNAIPTFPILLTKKTSGIPHNYEMFFYRLNVDEPENGRSGCYIQPQFDYYTKIPFVENMEIRGIFQCEKYFINHKQEILDLFSTPPKILEYLNNTHSDIIYHPKTVSIHVRFFQKEELKKDLQPEKYITYGIEYYQKAMNLFDQNVLFVVFSNDIKQCKNMFTNTRRNIRFIEGEDYLYDFFLMSMCKSNIVSNSSFSWWAAYLNKNPHKVVVAPSPWRNGDRAKDIIPEGWIQIDMSSEKQVLEKISEGSPSTTTSCVKRFQPSCTLLPPNKQNLRTTSLRNAS